MTGFLSYNSILNYEPRKKEEPTCVGCIHFTAMGGGEHKNQSQCLGGQKLWTAKTCHKHTPIKKEK